MNPYHALPLAIASEVAGTTALKLSEGFANPLPSLGVVVGYLASFYFLGPVLEELPVGLVYATRAAVGVLETVGVGHVVFDESLDVAGVIGVALVIVGVVVLNVYSGAYAPAH